MPPKRKRVDDAEPSTSTTRSTRSSTRQTTSTTAAKKPQTTRKSKNTATDVSDHGDSSPLLPKKTKRTTAKSTTAKKAAKIKPPPSSSNDNSNQSDCPPEKERSSFKPNVKLEPYSQLNVSVLFENYADKENPDAIGAQNFGRLCTDAGIPLEGALPLLLLWQLGAKELGIVGKGEWMKIMEELKISSLSTLRIFLSDMEDLLLTNSPPRTVKNDGRPYDRTQYFAYAIDRKGSFTKFYAACFLLVKTGQSRNIEMETAVAFWSVLLAPQYPIMHEIIMFINDKGTYKAANKDVWSMMLEFCGTVDPNLDNYEADGAWPTLLDDFVSWKKDQAGGDKRHEKKVDDDQ